MKSLHSAILILTIWRFSNCLAAGGGSWNYKRDDTTYGPDKWADNFEGCGLQENSPINIVKEDAIEKAVSEWTLTGWDKANTWTVLDTLYTIKYSLSGSAITTDGGDLGSYKLLQFHFHWGANNSKGSEHQLDGKSYPMEVHFVHMNSEFDTIDAAVQSGDSDALAAVGFFFEIQSEDNPKLAKIIDGIKLVRAEANLTLASYSLDALSEFTSTATSGNFYRYFGGLTTPGCQQIVKWTVFDTPIGISQAQMDVFRNQNTTVYGSELYRDVQPLGERVVTLYNTAYTPKTTTTTTTTTTSTTKPCDADDTCGASAIVATTALVVFSLISKFV